MIPYGFPQVYSAGLVFSPNWIRPGMLLVITDTRVPEADLIQYFLKIAHFQTLQYQFLELKVIVNMHLQNMRVRFYRLEIMVNGPIFNINWRN